MSKIKKLYINEAIRIRQEYINAIKSVQTKEQIILEYKSKIDNLMKNMQNVIDDIMSDKKFDENGAKTFLNNKMLEIETNMDKIKDELKPIESKINDLKKNSKTLYNNIKQTYPDMSDKEIHDEIIKYVKM